MLMAEITSTTSQQASVRVRPILLVLFIAGVMLLITAALIIHGHPRPYPIDLEAAQDAQTTITNPAAVGFLEFWSTFNDPLPSSIALAVWLIGLVVIGFIARRRGKSPRKWYEAAAGLALTVGIASGINFLCVELVARPRPGSFGEHIHVLTHRMFFSFPSGHTEHDVAYYGFLLFLSFLPQVRAWRFRWLLIPFQAFCVLDLIFIGISRVFSGEHWLTDVLGGYLDGAIWLLAGIFLYRWLTVWASRKKEAKRQLASAA